VLLAGVLLASCSSAGSSGATGATVARATTTTDPYAVPPTIDIPYLNRVFAALEKINGDATRLIVANKRITPDAAKLLHSIYTNEEFEAQAEVWNNEIDRGLSTFRPTPGDRRVTAHEILRTGGDCVAVVVITDYNAIRLEPKEPSEARINLVRAATNPTRWAMSKDLTSGPLPCA
jgi:hypothetical protein